VSETPDWTHREQYMLDKHGVTTTEANEAFADPNRAFLSPDPASTSGASDRTIGWSITAESVLVVITVLEEGHLWGVNGWKANATARRIYQEEGTQ
jgi:uncharacterized DUF497 family protein